jgi:hypothetical protein
VELLLAVNFEATQKWEQLAQVILAPLLSNNPSIKTAKEIWSETSNVTGRKGFCVNDQNKLFN